MRRLWRTALVCGCAALALAGAAAPRARDVTDQTWRWVTGPEGGVIVRESSSGRVARIQISVTCADGGFATPEVNSPITVASDGSFAYDGPDETAPDSRLTLNGRFGDRLIGSYAYRGGTCVVPTTSFTADCEECAEPPPPPSEAPFGPTSRDRVLVPFKEVGRAPLGSTAAAFRAKYPKQNYLGQNRLKGETLMFFGFKDAEEEPAGPRLLVYVNIHGKVWRVGARTEDLTDQTSWVRTSAGVGIGSTRAEVKRAFPKLQCGTGLFVNGRCGVISGKKPNLRTTEFAFDGGLVTAVSVAAWGLYYG
jgi:hypothetical protein